MATFSNWAGNLHSEVTILLPRTLEELQHMVRHAARRGRVRALGRGCAYMPLVPTDAEGDTIIDMRLLSRCLGVAPADDPPAITVEAGMPMRKLSDLCSRWGLTLMGPTVFPDITIGGATATASHGTGREGSTLSDDVAEVILVDAQGELQRIDAGDPRWPAACASLGVLGVIYALTLRVRPAFAVTARQVRLPLEQAIVHIDRAVQTHAFVEMYWFPGQPDAWLLLGDPTPLPGHLRRRNRIARALRDTATRIAGGHAIPLAARHAPRVIPWIQALGHRFVFHDSLRVVPAPEAFHYQTAYPPVLDHSIAVPMAFGTEAWQRLTVLVGEEAAAGRHPVNFVVHARYLGPGNAWLSLAYREATCALEVVSAMGTPGATAFSEQLERSMFSAIPGARPHLGKWIAFPREALGRLDPTAVASFLKVRQAMDPGRVFLNRFVERELLQLPPE